MPGGIVRGIVRPFQKSHTHSAFMSLQRSAAKLIMGFQLAWRTRSVMLMVPGWLMSVSAPAQQATACRGSWKTG
jgi:hypothetical protein